MTDITQRLFCPVTLVVEEMAALLNAEFVDHPVYDGIELQRFDDAVHGTGMLAFLSRREDQRVDYYVDPALALDRSGYEIGGGTGTWVETEFAAARLEVDADGVVAEVRFTDVDGRWIEVDVDDRDAGPRRAGDLLAPVGSSVERPASLLLAFLHGFDLVRRGKRAPRIAVDGVAVTTGRLPLSAVHRRHLVKAAGPVTVARVCPDHRPPADDLVVEGGRVTAVRATQGDATAEVVFQPGLSPVADRSEKGAWHVVIDAVPITGGTWTIEPDGDGVLVSLDVTRRWKPAGGQTPLMRIVTRVAPVFRKWPTTYTWQGRLDLGVTPATVAGRWSRDGDDRSYRRLTQG